MMDPKEAIKLLGSISKRLKFWWDPFCGLSHTLRPQKASQKYGIKGKMTLRTQNMFMKSTPVDVFNDASKTTETCPKVTVEEICINERKKHFWRK